MSAFQPWDSPRFKHQMLPKQLTKAAKKKAEEAHRKAIKKLVFARDGGMCRVCGDKATEMHELLFRSLMGERSTVNSIAVCAFGSPHNCHGLLQKHAIDVQGKDANKRLIFSWAEHIPLTHRFFRILSKRRSQR